MNPKSYEVGTPTDSTESVDRGDYRDDDRLGDRGRMSESHGRTDGLTKNNSPESVVLRNASRAGGQNDPVAALNFFAERYLALLAKLNAVRDLCYRDSYTTWDQERHLGDPPWRGPAVDAWERAHGHDPRLKCYPEFGCQLLIDPEDVLAVVAGVSRVTPQDQDAPR